MGTKNVPVAGTVSSSRLTSSVLVYHALDYIFSVIVVVAWQAMLQSSLVHVRILLGWPTAAERLHFHFISFPAFPYSWHGRHVLVCKLLFIRWVWWNSQGIPQGLHLGICRAVSASEQLHQNLVNNNHIFLKQPWVTPPYFLIHTNILYVGVMGPITFRR